MWKFILLAALQLHTFGVFGGISPKYFVRDVDLSSKKSGISPELAKKIRLPIGKSINDVTTGGDDNKRMSVTECVRGKCMTCIDDESCHDHGISDVDEDTDVEQLPEIAEFCKKGKCRTCFGNDCFESNLADGPVGLPEDFKLDPDQPGTRIISTQSSTIIRCDQDECEKCVDGDCKPISRDEVEFPEIKFPKFPSFPKSFGNFPSLLGGMGDDDDLDDMGMGPSSFGSIDRSMFGPLGQSIFSEKGGFGSDFPDIDDFFANLGGLGPLDPNDPNVSSQTSSIYTMNGKTQICENGECRTVNATNIRSYGVGGCTTAYCSADCEGFVMVKEKDAKCPMCKCSGYGTRELCDSKDDCPTEKCKDGFCVYPEPAGDVQSTCGYTFQCPANQVCMEGMCDKPDDSDTPKHQPGVSCSFQFMCPKGYRCEAMTCWEGAGREHLPDKFCIVDKHCPKGFRRCRDMTCFREANAVENKSGEKQKPKRNKN